MRISVCVATVRAELIGATIASVQDQGHPDWEMVVVTQGPDRSAFGRIEEATAADGRIRVVHLREMNRCNALNVAMRLATGDVFAFTDDDCEVAPDWLERLDELFEAHPDVGVIGGELAVAPNRRPWTVSTCPSAHAVEAVYHPSRDGYRAPAGLYMIGANTAIRREVAERVGEFDTMLGPGTPFPACEDLDFMVRAEAADIGIMTTKRVLVHHSGGRRYGMTAFLAHHRNYARGRGAYVRKLQLAGHRLGDVWSARPTTRQRLVAAVRNPPRFLLNDLYYGFHQRRAAQEFGDGYVLAPGGVSRRRSEPATGGDATTGDADGGSPGRGPVAGEAHASPTSAAAP